MKQRISEKQEIQIRRNIRQWQRRQMIAGNACRWMCLASCIALVVFMAGMGGGAGGFLAVSLALMVFSAGFLIRSAREVVRHQQILTSQSFSRRMVDPSSGNAIEVIDVEAVPMSIRHWN
jgi:hypothetical protein